MNILIEDFERDLSRGVPQDLLRLICSVLGGLCTLPPPATMSIDMLLEYVGEKTQGSRDAALFVLKIVTIPAFLSITENPSLQLSRKIVKIAEVHLPDICQIFKLNELTQNSDKFIRPISIFDDVISALTAISKVGTTVNSITSDVSGIYKNLSAASTKAILSIYDYTEFSTSVKDVLTRMKTLAESGHEDFSERYRDLAAIAEAYMSSYSTRFDPLGVSIARPFFNSVERALKDLGEESTEKFACNARLWRRAGSSSSLERRFPLHDPSRVVRIKIPLTNDGPGSAVDVRVEIACSDSQVIIDPSVQELGTMRPSTFPIYIDVAIGAPMDHLDLMVDLSWRSAISNKRDTHTFECRILAQDSSVDWELLEQIEPYSTAVAEGSAFVGRAQKLQSITSRLQKKPMQSSLITGQKRVGKTSLALAVANKLRSDVNYSIIYLEYGDYAQLDAKSTIEYLCQRLFDELESVGAVPSDAARAAPRSSLAVINQMAQVLYKTSPDQRVIVILDEFDEIHPEMYRYGAIAETFFSNLRTLSAKQNVAFVLVGGENMPFIVAAQGDQLNKFVSENVDYFVQKDEWEDYCRLVDKEGVPLRWHGVAIDRVFHYTHGHPYYTNLLCAEILRGAASARDTDITEDEVDVAVLQLASNMNTNVFAHFWKDGVPGERDHAEVVALKRCKFLVACAKMLRNSDTIHVDGIAKYAPELLLDAVDIAPIMNDFMRRGIIYENGGAKSFAVPMFSEWLKANGIRLIADTLGAELEASIKSAEELAYVTSTELVSLVNKWPLYKGRKIDAEMVRSWLSQAGPNTAQRILFKILLALEFVSEEQVREMVRQLHSQVKVVTSVYAQPSRSQRRYDLLVTYVDGPAKSGAAYASKYAEENLISSQCVIERSSFAQAAAEVEKRAVINGVVIVDDIAGTGDSLSSNLVEFFRANENFFKTRDIPVIVAVMYATQKAEENIRQTIRAIGYDKVDLRVCKPLTKMHQVLEREDIWDSDGQQNQARQLVESAGRQVYKDNPLGYGGLGLNVVFFDTCPNNSLPILHSKGKNWAPLFPRIAN